MAEKKATLVRGLTIATVFTLITGAMVGMAWATLTNTLFAYAGPAVLLSAIIAAFFCVLIGLCYAELCAAMPLAGGEYYYTKRSMGNFASFLTGWFLIIAYSSMMPGEVIIFSKVASTLMPESWLVPGATILGYQFPPTAMIIVGVVAAVFFGAINYIGIKLSAIVQLVFTIFLFIGMAIYIFGSLPQVNLSNFTGPFFDKGVGGMLMMVPIAILAFMGFDLVTKAAEEIKSPIEKVVWLIPLSVVVVLFFYVGVFFVSAGVVPYTEIAQSKLEVPIEIVASKTLGETGFYVVVIAGLMGLITTLNGFLIGSSRLMYGMAKDGVLPRAFSYIHPRFGTPSFGIVVLTLVGILGAFFQFLFTLFTVASAAILLAYILVCISLLILRKKEPNMKRPYRLRAPKIVASLAIFGAVMAFLFSIYIIVGDAQTRAVGSSLFFGLTAVGLVYYFFIVRKRGISAKS
ncbi:MAG: amino acid permease [Deltaproteobacteria bacterium]|nr:amino acid permease [Candidatus Zymogenaceae bacterium]